MTTTRMSSKLVKHESPGILGYSHWCSACKHCHTFYIQCNNHTWTFDGNVNSPTFSPSMLEYYTQKNGERKTLCHYILTSEVMNYCGDSPHELSGKSVPLEDIPSEYGFGDIMMKDLPSANASS